MPLFEFDLKHVDQIVPWGEEPNLALSWFALTDGWFRMPVGSQTLFEYTKEIAAHWSVEQRNPDYQIAAFTREMLGCYAAAVTPLPKFIEHLAKDWELLTLLQVPESRDGTECGEPNLSYLAWRWLGERSPWTSYLAAEPKFHFLRIGNDVRICWNNRGCKADGIPVWTTEYGFHTMPVETFCHECSDFRDRLLDTMNHRIGEIESGVVSPQVSVSVPSLRLQHEEWRKEFSSYFGNFEPDISWLETEQALRAIAKKKGIEL